MYQTEEQHGRVNLPSPAINTAGREVRADRDPDRQARLWWVLHVH